MYRAECQKSLQVDSAENEAMLKPKSNDKKTLRLLRALARPALSRAAGAPLTGNNSVRPSKDPQQNYSEAK